MLLDNALSGFLLLATSERRLAPRTIALYARALKALGDYARARGYSRLEDLTPNLVRGAALAQMSQPTGHAANYRGGEVMATTLIAAARTMVRRLGEEYPELGLPDLSVVRAPKIPERIQVRLQDGEFARLEAALKLRLLRDRAPRFLVARDLAILEVLSNTGLRAAECCAMDTGDVDVLEGTITIRDAKGGGWRILTVRDPDEPRDGGEVVRALKDYLRYRERTFGQVSCEALWLTPKANRLNPNGLRLMLRVLCEEASIPSNRPPHAFRRSYFTEQYSDNPLALPVLIRRMGWANDSMARVYTRGVDVELARRVPLPLASKRWRQQSSPAPVRMERRSDTLSTGAGPPRAGDVQRPGPAHPGKGRQEPGRQPKPARSGLAPSA